MKQKFEHQRIQNGTKLPLRKSLIIIIIMIIIIIVFISTQDKKYISYVTIFE